MSSFGPMRRLRRRLNRRFYRCLYRFYRGLFPTPPWPGQIPAGSLGRVLIVRHDHVGDMVATTPLIAFLKEHVPQAELDVLASPSSARLVADDKRISRIFLNDHSWRGWFRVLPRLRARRYDVIFSLVYGRGLREGMTASLIARRATYKISVWRPARYVGFFTMVTRFPRSVRHMADQLLYTGHRALGRRWPGNAAAAHYAMHVAVPAAARDRASSFLTQRGVARYVVVNLAATDVTREWPPEPCAEFVSALLARYPDLAVVIAPPAGKEGAAEQVELRCGSRVLVAKGFPLLELVALLERSLVVITPDTGVLHLASATGRPVVALYTPTSVHLDRWLPWGVPYRVVMAPPEKLVGDIPPASIAASFNELYDEVVQGAPGERPTHTSMT